MKRQLRNRTLVLLIAAACTLSAAPAARAQDKPAPKGAAPGGGEEGGAEQAEALVKRIQGSLAEVDAALERASGSESVAAGVQTAERKHLEAIRDIEALIKQIKYRQSKNPSKGGGGSGGKGSSDDQLSGKAPPQPSDGSQAPKPSGGRGEKPKPEGEQQGEEGRKPAGGKPQGGTPGANEPGNRLPPDETGKFTRTDTDARWGLLPPKLQERLMNLHVDDVPERYRAWLDAYIHALNAREQEGTTR